MHGLLAGVSLFFWARLVDRTGNVGPWYPTGIGVNGQASSDQSEYEEYFAGQIGESALGQHLGDRINLIDGPADLPGSVNNRIQVVSGEVSAISEKVDGVFAQVNPPMAGSTEDLAGSTESFVGVWSVQSAVIEGDVATGKLVETVQAQVGQNSAVIQEVSQAQVDLSGKASTMWSMKMQIDSNGHYVTAGIGLGLENQNGVFQSQFIVSADRFAVVSGMGGSLGAPFVIQNGQTFINSLFVAEASITNGKIGGALYSLDYVPNTTGWMLPRTGAWEMNGSNGAGRLQINNTSIKFYHPNGVVGIDMSL